MHISNVFDQVGFGVTDLWSMSDVVDVKMLFDYVSSHDLNSGRDLESFFSNRFRNMNRQDAEVLSQLLEVGEYLIKNKTNHTLKSVRIYEYESHDHICEMLKRRFGMEKGTVTSLLLERIPLPETNFVLPEWCVSNRIEYSKDGVLVPTGDGIEEYEVDNDLNTDFANEYPSTFCNWIDTINERDRLIKTPELATA